VATIEERLAALEAWNVVQKDWNRKVNARQSKVEESIEVLGARIASSGGGTGGSFPPPETPETPPPPPPSGGVDGVMYVPTVYGPGMRIGSKGNIRVGPNNLARVSTRFVASHDAITKVALQIRLGSTSGYSGGTGGHWTIAVFADSGGEPTGVALGSTTYNTGQSAGAYNRFFHHTLSAPSVVAGNTYHVVVTDSSSSNFASVNLAHAADAPIYTDDFAILVYRDGTWTTEGGSGVGSTTNYVPVIDITYANGEHDGNQFHELMLPRWTTSATTWVSEQFTATRDFSATAARVAPISGSGTLTVDLRTAGGTILGTGTTTVTNGWHRATFSAVAGTEGTAYRIVARGGSYVFGPMRAVGNEDSAFYGGSGAASAPWGSYGFTEGLGYYSTNSGSSWTRMYANSPSHLSSYLEVA
jgi:hypothetical protein